MRLVDSARREKGMLGQKKGAGRADTITVTRIHLIKYSSHRFNSEPYLVSSSRKLGKIPSPEIIPSHRLQYISVTLAYSICKGHEVFWGSYLLNRIS